MWLLGRLLAHLMDGPTGRCCQLAVNESQFLLFVRESFPFCVVLKCKNCTARVVVVLKMARTRISYKRSDCKITLKRRCVTCQPRLFASFFQAFRQIRHWKRHFISFTFSNISAIRIIKIASSAHAFNGINLQASYCAF